MTTGIINILFFSLLFGVGVFFIALSPSWRRAKQDMERIDELRQIGIDAPVGEIPLIQDISKRGLEKALAQAGLPVTPAQFIRFGLIIGLVSAASILSLVGSLIVAVFVGLGSVVLYVRWLYDRREQLRMGYEEAIGRACEYMGVGAQADDTLEGAMKHSLELVDPILRDDVDEVINLLSQNASVTKSFAGIQKKRQSQALDFLAETLIIWDKRGSKLSLKDVLSPLRLIIQKNVSTQQKMDAELSGPKRTMIIVAIAPIIFVVLMRLSSPAYAQYYTTPQGELLQIVSYSIAMIGLVFGERALKQVRKVIEIDASD